MSDPQQYTLRWRGRETGPYPVSEINRMLDEHEIGMGHEILSGDKWITLEEFFASPPKPSAPPPAQPPSSPTPAAKIPSPTIPGPTLAWQAKTSPPPAKLAGFQAGGKSPSPAGRQGARASVRATAWFLRCWACSWASWGRIIFMLDNG